MFLEEISLVNFRNLSNQSIKFKPTVNIFYGDNAQGKTNVLEAIYLLSSAKSFRTRSDKELITWGQAQSKVSGKIGSLEVEIKIEPNSKELLINRQQKSLTELIGSFIAIVFTPTDIEIISGSPSERRRFLDHFGSNLDKKYLHNLVQLNKILKNRNQVLYQLRQGRNLDLEVWNEQLVKTASFVWLAREELIKKLSLQLKTLGKRLTQSEVIIEYQPPFSGEAKKTLEEKYHSLLSKIKQEEIRRNVTLVGPHRDDFKIVAEITEENKVISKDLSIYGSRGEQRSVALALKLAELAVIEDERKLTPILLLDEVLSELDQRHRDLLLKQVKKLQTVITTTSIENMGGVGDSSAGKFRGEAGLVKLA